MKLMALSSAARATNPAAMLDRLSENILALEELDVDGHMSPEGVRWFHAAHVLALRAAGRERDAEALLRAAQKKLSDNFNPEEVVAAAMAELTEFPSSEGIPSFSEAQLAAPLQPKWPWEVEPPAVANCLVRFNVSERGKAFSIKALCDDNRFLKSAENAIKRAQFHPKTKQGKAVTRYSVVQPLEYR